MMSFHDHRISVFIMISSSSLISPFEEGMMTDIASVDVRDSKYLII